MTRESNVQAQIQIAAARNRGAFLMRNNSGALMDERGRMVRYGLGNVSKAVNEKLKSSDLVGIRPVLITQDMVGQTIGQFIAIECKPPGWRGFAGDARAEAQNKWHELVRSWGGVAGFASSVETAEILWLP